MIDLVIPVTQLTEQTVTRSRGTEAYNELVRRLSTVAHRPACVIIDLSVSPMVSGSFMDELVLRISALSSDLKFVFRLAARQDTAKLRKVCAIRNAACYYQIGESGPVRSTRRHSVAVEKAERYDGAFFTP